jgi:hypothetical protein
MTLAPDQRALLMDAFRPPAGYQFDRGIGTSFTLDLMTLLVAPLSLALHDVSSTLEALSDPVLLMDGIQRYAERLTLFSQVGYISVPKQTNPLYRYLEEMIVAVKAPNGGLFHPKVWLLRYVSENAPVVYRFLCLSRNMVFSQSWDVILRLDGELQDRQLGYGRNRPLAEFVGVLPEFALHPISARIASDIALLVEEVRKVDFTVPRPFFPDGLEFVPLGHRLHRRYRLDKGQSRSMVISPFLSPRTLEEVTTHGDAHILLSEAESMRRIDPRVLERFSNLYMMNDAALNPPADGTREEEENDPEGHRAQRADPSRLHAKLFILEKGWDAQWLMGSANATTAAFEGKNVEFMVALRGRKAKVGIELFLGDENSELALRAMLADYLPDDRRESDPEAQAAERLLESVRGFLVGIQFGISVLPDGDENYSLILRPGNTSKSPLLDDLSIRMWPVTLAEDQAQSLSFPLRDSEIAIRGLSMLALTSFIAFEVKASFCSKTRSIRFVLNLPVTGMPETRDNVILTAILNDSSQFLRYLRYLLAEELGWLPALDQRENKEKFGGWEGGGIDDLDIPLLEDLARAFSRSPEKIDQVSTIVEKLCASEEGRKVLPAGFESLWNVLREARESTR